VTPRAALTWPPSRTLDELRRKQTDATGNPRARVQTLNISRRRTRPDQPRGDLWAEGFPAASCSARQMVSFSGANPKLRPTPKICPASIADPKLLRGAKKTRPHSGKRQLPSRAFRLMSTPGSGAAPAFHLADRDQPPFPKWHPSAGRRPNKKKNPHNQTAGPNNENSKLTPHLSGEHCYIASGNQGAALVPKTSRKPDRRQSRAPDPTHQVCQPRSGDYNRKCCCPGPFPVLAA